MECQKSRRQIVRVKPRAFDCDWKADLLAAGVKIPKKYSVLRYTPVNHDPMPFSVEIDLGTMKLVKQIIGVMPNATYPGHIYSWDEFCRMIPAVTKGLIDEPVSVLGQTERRNKE